MILFPGRHLMGVLECHQSTPPNNMVELKTVVYLAGAQSKNNDRKKRKTRISVSGHETWSTGQIDVLIFLPRVRFTQNHPIFYAKLNVSNMNVINLY